MRRIAVLILVLSVSGCISESTLLVNKDGKTTSCGAVGFALGVVIAAGMHHDCIVKAHAAGYWESKERAEAEAQKVLVSHPAQ